MPHSFPKAVLATAVLIGLGGSAGRLSAQATQAGIEQARRDSVRRPYTTADIAFMSGMIMHHAQAVKMAGWAASHGASQSLQVYCGRVAMAQAAEIGLMKQWLAERNQPVPAIDTASADMMAHMNMPGMQHDASMKMMPGMLSPAQMHQLDASRGVEFDRMFLIFMIQHHRGALQMVDTLFKTPGAAQDEIVFKFANDVQADQTTEIDRMQQMLDALPPAPGELEPGRS